MDADTLPVGLQELAGFGRGLTQVKVEIIKVLIPTSEFQFINLNKVSKVLDPHIAYHYSITEQIQRH